VIWCRQLVSCVAHLMEQWFVHALRMDGAAKELSVISMSCRE
jgi:hypothetical protein